MASGRSVAGAMNAAGEIVNVIFEERLEEDEDEDYRNAEEYDEDVEYDEDEDDDEDDEDDEDDDDEEDNDFDDDYDDDEDDDAATLIDYTHRTQYLLRMLAAHPDVRPNVQNIMRLSAEIDQSELTSWPQRRRRNPPDPNRFPKVPSVVGAELMASGDFGSNDVQSRGKDNLVRRQKRLTRRILDREIASGNFASQKINRRIMAQEMLPSSPADTIINYDAPVYSGQFSDDGNFFFAVTKDFKVRMYDTSSPYKWRYYKTVVYPYGQWTLTDASLSPDNKYLAYTSIRSTVCLAPTDPHDMGEPYNLELGDAGAARHPRPHSYERRGSFGIWSIRFSGDGRELVAGTTGGSIVVYDIEARRTLHRIFGHEEDVNAVCFADKSSPHILYSGSDDATIKVWDTRSMGDSREAGAFIGHIEGLTYLDSKGDGRYVLSNGKDQSMKLWDLRMVVMSSAQFSNIRANGRRSRSNFDYRWGVYDEDDWYHHENDNSLVTFRGHRVMRTLIRCHFSPPGSTNSRYVYSGSEDGKVYIWNMDATLAGKVDVFQATQNTRPPPDDGWLGGRLDDLDELSGWRWKTVVRDAAWHPAVPMIAASAWNGYGAEQGTVTTHSWNEGAEDDEAEPKMGLRVNAELERDPLLYESPTRSVERRRRSQRIHAHREEWDDNDD